MLHDVVAVLLFGAGALGAPHPAGGQVPARELPALLFTRDACREHRDRRARYRRDEPVEHVRAAVGWSAAGALPVLWAANTMVRLGNFLTGSA